MYLCSYATGGLYIAPGWIQNEIPAVAVEACPDLPNHGNVKHDQVSADFQDLLANSNRIVSGMFVTLLAAISGEIPFTFGTVRRQIRIARDCSPSIICRWCDFQNPADRPDAKDNSVFLNEHDHRLNGRSSSAAAKYADAYFRISSAVRSSRFSRSNSLILSFSTLVRPARFPASRSAC